MCAIGDAYDPGLELHNRRSAPLQPADAQRLIDRRFSGLVGRAPDARHSRAAVRSRLRISIVYDRQRERERLPDLRALRRRRIDDLGRRVRWLVEVDRRAAAAIGRDRVGIDRPDRPETAIGLQRAPLALSVQTRSVSLGNVAGTFTENATI
jgi:hypothetical protein